MEGDFFTVLNLTHHHTFQSTPPHGGRPIHGKITVTFDMFQSTPPHGGRHEVENAVLFLNRFNPRPRMEGDFSSPWLILSVNVSIHAPAWRATRAAPDPIQI